MLPGLKWDNHPQHNPFEASRILILEDGRVASPGGAPKRAGNNVSSECHRHPVLVVGLSSCPESNPKKLRFWRARSLRTQQRALCQMPNNLDA